MFTVTETNFAVGRAIGERRYIALKRKEFILDSLIYVFLMIMIMALFIIVSF